MAPANEREQTSRPNEPAEHPGDELTDGERNLVAMGMEEIVASEEEASEPRQPASPPKG